VSLEKALFIDPNTIQKYTIEQHLKTGDLLLNSTGLGTLGRIGVYDEKINSYEFTVADSHVTVIRPCNQQVNSTYLYSWFSGPYVQENIEDKGSGSTKQKELATETVKNHLVPLPPLSEQERIVAKIEELMGIIDKIKA
ncbi:MAG TPA: restriction endonuclease subunit S, partial [Methanocorpusculum sp.]|nr:restriction endonuclease subunit S [Methanocorpusculum sp.]